MIEDAPEITDEELVILIRNGDSRKFAVIIRRYQDKLIRYATYLTGDDQKAADAVQESFIKGYINLNSFDHKRKFSSWIYRIVHNEAVNQMSRNRKQVPMGDWDYDSGISLEEELEEKELKADVVRCLKKIPLMYSEPLALHFLEDKSYEEISDILRLPVGTVGTRINRAKLIMKKICKQIS